MKKIITLLFVLVAVSYTFSQSTAYKEGLNKPVFFGISDDLNSKSICDQNLLTNGFENAYPCNSANSNIIANDITVNANEHFVLNQITAELWTDAASTVTSVTITYYEDNSGLPGTEIGSQSGITPVSQTVIGNNYGWDIHETVLNVTPFVFEGQEGVSTPYWIGISASTPGLNMYWGITTGSSSGEPMARFNSSWSIPNITYDGVYTFSGDCVPLCAHFNLTDAYENAYNCGINSQYKTANDFIVEADHQFILEQIEARIWTYTGNAIVSVVITYYDDNGGFPGNEIGSETLVPSSQTIIKSGVFGSYDVHRIILDVTPVTFLGQTGEPITYWIQLAVEDNLGLETYWSVTSHNIVGNDFAFKTGEDAWVYEEPGMDGIYVFYGDCSIANAVNNTNDAGDFSIYPNPNNGIFSVDLNMLNNLPANIEVMDIQGRTIVELTNITSENQKINLSNYAKGIYYVRISSEEVNETKKVSIIK